MDQPINQGGLLYMTSMCSVFKRDLAFTTYEYSFGMLSELAVAFIYGGLAGLVGTVMARSQAQEH